MSESFDVSEGGEIDKTKDPSLSPIAREHPAPLRLGSNASTTSHRQSITDQLRGHPPSPRAQRQPSLSQSAIHELLNRASATQTGDPAFLGRDWKTIHVGELVGSKDATFVESNEDVEEATKKLVSSDTATVLIRESMKRKSFIGTFDFNDLNAYLLLVIGLLQPSTDAPSLESLAKKAREGEKIPIGLVKDISKREPHITLAHNVALTRAVEMFGSGIHRIIILKENTEEVVGVLTQLRLVRFLWENAKSFSDINQLYSQYLQNLGVGSHEVISINGDRPLSEALQLMNAEGVTSLAVVDNSMNVVGNISTVDVKLLTESSSLPILESTCIHFISIILSSRGIEDGKDSVPVFYVNPYSTLAHTVAKLVATKSHRMWIVESPSPGSSVPDTPLTGSAILVPPPIHTPVTPITPSVPQIPPSPNALASYPSVSAASLPGSSMSGKLTGVVSLTDILNLYAKHTGLSPLDPSETRRQRRRSSSSSMQERMSLENKRSSSMDIRR